MVIAPSFTLPIVLDSEILLTFLPEILIRSSLKVIEILFGDSINIALLFGLLDTSAVCAFAAGAVAKIKENVTMKIRFIFGKDISRCDIKEPSVALTTEGPRWGRLTHYRGGNLLFAK